MPCTRLIWARLAVSDLCLDRPQVERSLVIDSTNFLREADLIERQSWPSFPTTGISCSSPLGLLIDKTAMRHHCLVRLPFSAVLNQSLFRSRMSRLLLPCVLLLAWINSSARADFNLTVLHTNDVHCRFEEANKYGSMCTEKEAAKGKCFGGYARLVHQLREIRQQEPNAIYLHGGDFFQGTIWYTIHKWKVVSHFTNFLNLTAMVIIFFYAFRSII